MGRRIEKNVDGVVTRYLYSNEGLIGEYDANNNLKKSYGWMPNGIWGTDPLYMTENNQSYFYHNDALGTPQKMTDASGNVVWSASYTSFGEATINPSSTITSNLRFAGQYFDSETGVNYNLFRVYDPKTGKYISKDPISFAAGDTNLYRYVFNSPVNYTDPLGLETWMCEKPLDQLCEWGIECSGTKNLADTSWNPLYHQYICVGKEDSPSCGGQSSGGKPYGPGKPSDDKYDKDKCKEKNTDNDCLENCIQKKIQNPKRPYYGLVGPGTNCQEWADKTYTSCVKECKKKEKKEK